MMKDPCGMWYRHVDINHDCTKLQDFLAEQGIAATTAQCCLNGSVEL